MPRDVSGLSLEQIDGVEWGPPPCDTHLVRTMHALRLKAVGEFTAGDLLTTVLDDVSAEYRREHPEQASRLDVVVGIVAAMDDLDRNGIPGRAIRNGIERYRAPEQTTR